MQLPFTKNSTFINLLTLSLILLCNIPGWQVFGSEQHISGIVRTGGSQGNESVMIEQKILSSSRKKNPVTTHLCYDAGGARVKKLSGLKVRLRGRYQPGGKGTQRCFSTNDFTVLKMSSGRPPLIGTLTEKDGFFQVTTESGKQITLRQKGGGLRDLVDKKVILDVKPPPPISAGVSPGVASYMEYP